LFFKKLNSHQERLRDGPYEASATRIGRVPIPTRKGRDECFTPHFPIILGKVFCFRALITPLIKIEAKKLRSLEARRI